MPFSSTLSFLSDHLFTFLFSHVIISHYARHDSFRGYTSFFILSKSHNWGQTQSFSAKEKHHRVSQQKFPKSAGFLKSLEKTSTAVQRAGGSSVRKEPGSLPS